MHPMPRRLRHRQGAGNMSYVALSAPQHRENCRFYWSNYCLQKAKARETHTRTVFLIWSSTQPIPWSSRVKQRLRAIKALRMFIKEKSRLIWAELEERNR